MITRGTYCSPLSSLRKNRLAAFLFRRLCDPYIQHVAKLTIPKNEPILSISIVPLPVYSHTAFLDDFFWRSFPYTQAEATPVLRTCGESSPLSKDISCVCAEISTCFIRRVPDPRRVRKGALRAVTASWGGTRLVQYSGKSF